MTIFRVYLTPSPFSIKMWSIVLVLGIVRTAVAAIPVAFGSSYAGDGTYYGFGASGACSWNFSGAYTQPWTTGIQTYVAMNAPQFASSGACGLCLKYKGTAAGGSGLTPIPETYQYAISNDLCPEVSKGTSTAVCLYTDIFCNRHTDCLLCSVRQEAWTSQPMVTAVGNSSIPLCNAMSATPASSTVSKDPIPITLSYPSPTHVCPCRRWRWRSVASSSTCNLHPTHIISCSQVFQSTFPPRSWSHQSSAIQSPT